MERMEWYEVPLYTAEEVYIARNIVVGFGVSNSKRHGQPATYGGNDTRRYRRNDDKIIGHNHRRGKWRTDKTVSRLVAVEITDCDGRCRRYRVGRAK